MQTKRRFATATVTVAAFLFGFLAIAGGAWAHCDTTQGPVVADARIALDRGDITPVLKWLKPDSETEVRAAFPGLAQPRWVALRLLEGDRQIMDAVRNGEIGTETIRP